MRTCKYCCATLAENKRHLWIEYEGDAYCDTDCIDGDLHTDDEEDETEINNILLNRGNICE